MEAETREERMSSTNLDPSYGSNPVDLVEQIASLNNWYFERSDKDEISFFISGESVDYQASFQWIDDIGVLHLACAFDVIVPEHQRDEMIKLLAFINQQMWVGHFDLWPDEGLVMYRHALLLAGGAEANTEQCKALLRNAVEAIERWFLQDP